MASADTTWTEAGYNSQIGNVGKLRTRRGVVTVAAGGGASGASLTAASAGLHEIVALIPESTFGTSGKVCSATIASGNALLFAFISGGANTIESGAAVTVTLLGH